MTTRDLIFLAIGVFSTLVVLTAISLVKRKRRPRGTLRGRSGASSSPTLPYTSPSKPRAPLAAPSGETVHVDLRKKRLVFTGPVRAFGLLCLMIIICAGAAVALFRSPRAVTQEPTRTETLIQLAITMEHGIERPEYRVELMPNNELVSDLAGDYYYVDFLDARSRESLFFDAEQYTKPETANDFREAVSAFRREILGVMGDSIPYQVFVQGSADATGNDAPYLAELITGDEKVIPYLPKESENLYRSTPDTQVVPKRYANLHLPNLRAAYAQEKLGSLDIESTILQGEITRRNEETDRRVTMVLFVAWPPDIKMPANGPD